MAARLRGLAGRSHAFDLVFKKFFERNSIVVLSIMGAVNERHSAPAGARKEWLPRLRVLLQFVEVAPSELAPFRRVVLEPLAQCRAGRHVLEPGLHSQVLLFHAARPEPFHEKTFTLIFARLFVSSLNLYHRRSPDIPAQHLEVSDI